VTDDVAVLSKIQPMTIICWPHSASSFVYIVVGMTQNVVHHLHQLKRVHNTWQNISQNWLRW